jgi:hypothetical protein
MQENEGSIANATVDHLNDACVVLITSIRESIF